MSEEKNECPSREGGEDLDTHVMSRGSRGSRGPSLEGADDTVETDSPAFGEGFEGLAASLVAPKPPSELDLLLARRDRSAVTTLPGLHEPPPSAPAQVTAAPPSSDAGATQPFDRKLLAGHVTVFEKLPTVIVGDALRAADPDRTQPSSIAPFAVDIDIDVDGDRDGEEREGAVDSPPYADASESAPESSTPRGKRFTTVRIMRVNLAARRRSLGRMLVALGVLAAGGILAFAAVRHSSDVRPAAEAAHAVTGITTLTGAEALPPALHDEPRPEPALVPVTGVIVTRKPTGTLLVDGERKRIEGGRVVVPCGKHRLGAGHRGPIVLVPCGGTLTR